MKRKEARLSGPHCHLDHALEVERCANRGVRGIEKSGAANSTLACQLSPDRYQRGGLAPRVAVKHRW